MKALELARDLQAASDDPMWANHAEISKRTCADAAKELIRQNEVCKIQDKQIEDLCKTNSDLLMAMCELFAYADKLDPTPAEGRDTPEIKKAIAAIKKATS